MSKPVAYLGSRIPGEAKQKGGRKKEREWGTTTFKIHTRTDGTNGFSYDPHHCIWSPPTGRSWTWGEPGAFCVGVLLDDAPNYVTAEACVSTSISDCPFHVNRCPASGREDRGGKGRYQSSERGAKVSFDCVNFFAPTPPTEPSVR